MASDYTIVQRANSLTSMDIIEAMRRNGYEQGQGQYIEWEVGTENIVRACAFGQAALNLSDPDWTIDDKCYFAGQIHEVATRLSRVFNSVVPMNDREGFSIQAIADYLEANLHDG